jgi:hypothetical protein
MEGVLYGAECSIARARLYHNSDMSSRSIFRGQTSQQSVLNDTAHLQGMLIGGVDPSLSNSIRRRLISSTVKKGNTNRRNPKVLCWWQKLEYGSILLAKPSYVMDVNVGISVVALR